MILSIFLYSVYVHSRFCYYNILIYDNISRDINSYNNSPDTILTLNLAFYFTFLIIFGGFGLLLNIISNNVCDNVYAVMGISQIIGTVFINLILSGQQ